MNDAPETGTHSEQLRSAAHRAAARFKLVVPGGPLRGQSGDLLGRGVGSSIEFQDFREYTPGDDVRHIDWASYARTDRYMVRLYREEIAPRVELLVDASCSMRTPNWEGGGSSKETVLRSLAATFVLLAQELGAPVDLWWLDDAPRLWPDEAANHVVEDAFDGRGDLAQALARSAAGQRHGSIRIVLSDFLFPHDPSKLHQRLTQGAGYCIFVQVLAAHEIRPVSEGQILLEDIESGLQLPLRLSETALRQYGERLRQLQDGLRAACLRSHSPFVVLNAGEGLDALCAGVLSRAAVLEAR